MTDDFFIDRKTRQEMCELLAVVPRLAEDLAVTLTRQDRISKPGGKIRRGKPESKIPFHIGAASASWELHNALSTTVRMVCEQRVIPQAQWPADSVTSLAAWLKTNIIAVALTEGAWDAWLEIENAVYDCRRVIDHPQTRSYQGPCPQCGGDLYAYRNEATISCPQCAAVIDKADNDRRVIDELERYSFTANELVSIISDRFGITVKPKTIHDMAYRKTNAVSVAGATYDRQKLYRAGDVFEQLRQRKVIA